MASSMIHIAVASEINKKINRDKSKLFIGTIAPDISKLIGQTKVESHFLDNSKTDLPNLGRFLAKYIGNLNDDFVLGYYIHLYTDYLWFKYFIPEIYNSDKHLITKLDGSIFECHGGMVSQYIYNDYTNLNINLIDDYDLDLKIFYNDIPIIDNIIDEIPMDKLDIIVNKAAEIIENTRVRKDLVFNMEDVHKFIEYSSDIILSDIENRNILDNIIKK